MDLNGKDNIPVYVKQGFDKKSKGRFSWMDNYSNAYEEEVQYKILKEKYEQAKIRLKERATKMREEALGIKEGQEDPNEKEFRARDIAEAGVGASEKECFKAKQRINEELITGENDHSIE